MKYEYADMQLDKPLLMCYEYWDISESNIKAVNYMIQGELFKINPSVHRLIYSRLCILQLYQEVRCKQRI